MAKKTATDNLIENLADQLIEAMGFDYLIAWADILGVEHDEEMWFDDEWPDLESQLRQEVAEAMANVGKTGD